jgi:hypothetical protein
MYFMITSKYMMLYTLQPAYQLFLCEEKLRYVIEVHKKHKAPYI